MIIKKLKGPNNRAVSLRHTGGLKNCTFTITQFSRMYPTPYPCQACHMKHEFKTIHLNLDNEGNVAITDYLYERLKGEGLLGELVATHETVPLPTVLNMGENRPPPIVMSREIGAVRLDGKPQVQVNRVLKMNGNH